MAHEDLKRQYAKDLLVNPKAYLAWEYYSESFGGWERLSTPPLWSDRDQYRRHPHADLILTYDPNTVYEWSKEGKPWQTVLNPPLWDEKLNYRKKPMAHEELKAQYEKDRTIYNEPHLLWEFRQSGPWQTVTTSLQWNASLQYRRKPEARPHAHLIHIWADGAEIQRLSSGGEWLDTAIPTWEPAHIYRQKPATQTRFIPIFRMPSSVYVGEGKINLADCKPSNTFDTLISVLEINISEDNSATLVKEHKP